MGKHVVLSGWDSLRILTTGKLYSGPWQHIYEFERGRVVRVENLGDTEQLMRAARRDVG